MREKQENCESKGKQKLLPEFENRQNERRKVGKRIRGAKKTGKG